MAESKKDLKKPLRRLVEINKQLEGKTRTLYEQVNLKTEECIQNQSQGHIDEIKVVVALVRETNYALLGHKKTISDVKKKLDKVKESQVMNKEVDCGQSLGMKLNLMDKSWSSFENENEISETNKKKNTSLEKKLEHVETELTSLKDTKQKTEDDLSDMKLWKENILENRIKSIEDKLSSLLNFKQATENDVLAIKQWKENNLEKRIECIESTQSSLLNATEAREKDVSEIKQWKDQFLTEKKEMEIKLQMSMKTKQELKILQKQMNEQNNKLHGLQNKDMIFLSEINKWRDAFLSDQSDKMIKIKQLSNEQKENYLNLRKHFTEIEHQIAEMSQLLDNLRENVSIVCRNQEKAIQDSETVDIIIKTINNRLQEQSEKIAAIDNHVESHSELISVIQNDGKHVQLTTTQELQNIKTMHNVMYRLLQQKLMPIDKLVKLFNQNLETREKNVKKLGSLENNVLKMLNDLTNIRQEINRHSDSISTLQADGKKIVQSLSEKLSKECSVIGKEIKTHSNFITTLQEYGKKHAENTAKTVENLTSKLETQVKDVVKLSKDFNVIETRVSRPYICQVHLNNDVPVAAGSIITSFYNVWESYGNNFNKTTGKFVAPDDGHYLFIITLMEQEDKFIKFQVLLGDELKKGVYVRYANTSVCGSGVAIMKKGQELCFKVAQADSGAKLQGGSGYTIFRL